MTAVQTRLNNASAEAVIRLRRWRRACLRAVHLCLNSAVILSSLLGPLGTVQAVAPAQASETPSVTPAETPAETPTPAETETPSATPSPSETPSPSATPVPSATPSPTETGPAGEGQLLATAEVILPEEELFQIGPAGGELVALGGRVRVVFPGAALPGALNVRVRPAWSLPHSLSAHPFEILAEHGEMGIPVRRFAAPITLEVSYDETELRGAESSLTLFWFDPQLQTWRPLPTRVDVEANVLSAVTDHLSVFDFDTQDWEAARLPSVASFQVAAFTGAGTYALPIQVPLGPAGLQPSLTLSYNSQAVDGADSRTQASWVGMGWSLDTGSIQRNLNGTHDDTGDDTFSIDVAGVSSLLLPIPDADGDPNTTDYRTADETFWRIRRYLATADWGYPADVSWWVVWDQSGTVYTFNPGPYYPEYIACAAPTLQRWQWPLASVRNLHGKELTFSYEYEFKTSRNDCETQFQSFHAVAVYPREVRYPNGRYRILFERSADRLDYDTAWLDLQAYVLFMRSRLTAVRIEHDANGDGVFEQLVREVRLTYEDLQAERVFPNLSWPAGGRTLTLAQVQEFGLNGTAALPATSFSYGDSMHLTRVDNGYGGRVELGYQAWAAEGSVDQGISQVWSPPQLVSGAEISLAELNRPAFHPGSSYRFEVTANSGPPHWATVGLNYGAGVARPTRGYLFPDPYDWRVFPLVVTLPATASQASPVFNCSWCSLSSVKLRLLPTRYRVSEKRLYNGIDPQPEVFSYSYSGAAMNDAAHSAGVSTSDPYVKAYAEFRGHSQVEQSGPGGRRTVTQFYQNDERKGRAFQVEVRDGGGNLFTQVATTFASEQQAAAGPPTFPHKPSGQVYTDLKIVWVYPTLETRRRYEGDASYASTRTETFYDPSGQGGAQYGNPTRSVEGYWSGSAWVRYRMTTMGYYPTVDGDRYLVGLPGYQNRYRCLDDACRASSEALLSSAWYLYDGALAYSTPPSAGKLTAQRRLLRFASPNYVDPRYSDETYAYDGWGNPTTVTRFSGEGTASALAGQGARSTTTVFDSTYHTYPASQKDALGRVTGWAYDVALGVPTREQDPNGATTTATYDGFGRLGTLRLPGDEGGPPTWELIYYDTSLPFTIVLRTHLDFRNTLEQRRFYDGLGRLLQTQTARASLAEGVRDVLVDYAYDAYGRVIRQSVPYAVSAGSGYRAPDLGQPSSQTSYDVLSRPLSVTATDGSRTSYDYDDLATFVKDPLDRTTHSVLDPWGRTLQVIPPLSPSVSYSYDALDRLTQASAGGALTTIAYDYAGRKLSLHDADMGAWSYAYDAVGNLLTQADARGCATSLSYDGLSRLTGKGYAGPGACGTTAAVSYGYDEGAFGIGRRTSMADGSGSSAWAYDARGRLTSETKTIAGAGTFLTSWAYDSADHIVSITYPDRELVAYSYHPQGVLDAVSSARGTYVQGTSYDAAGRIVSRVLGPGTLTTSYGYYPWDEPAGQGRLQRLSTAPQSPLPTLQDLRYGYDAIGNILRIEDWVAGPPQAQSYAYDALDRLTSAEVTGGADGLYAEAYSYHPGNGNLASKGGVAYGYLGTQPHAVTHLDGVERFVYDANGNMLERQAGGMTQLLTHDAEGRLVAVEATPTETPAATSTASLTLTPTTVTETPAASPTATATNTEAPLATPTPIRRKTATATPTPTPSSTARAKPTPTPSSTARPIRRPTGTQRSTSSGQGAWPGWEGLLAAAAQLAETPTPSASESETAQPSATSTPILAPNLSATPASVEATFVYDGDGNRVLGTINGVTTVYVGDHYEVEGATVRKYYSAGGQRLAMREDGVLNWLLADHLGSTARTVTEEGALVSELRYKGWGETRYAAGELPTTYGYTGQRQEPGIGLYYYRARWYDPEVARFVQADTVLPSLSNPQSYDRYSYAENNPIKFVDASGRSVELPCSYCDKPWVNISSWSPAATLLASAACLVIGCHVDRAQAVVSGPTREEWIEDSVSNMANPIAVPAAVVSRGGKVVVGTALEAIEQVATAGRTRSVYEVIENGVRRYVGQTVDFARRAGDHLRQRGWQAREIPGLSNLSQQDARAVEQALIEDEGLDNLYNMINSIARNNPIYERAIQRGRELLVNAGVLAD